VCSDIPGHVASILPAGTADQQACYVSALTWLCSAPSKEQDWHGQHGVAHIVSPDAPGDLGAIANQCGLAFMPATAKETFARMFTFGACDESAQMQDATSVVTTCGPSGAPTPVGSGPACP
jgi:hypothetical protein